MKKLLFLFSAFLSITLSANSLVGSKFGSDSVKCVTNISLYREYVKQNNYDDAMTPWRKAYTLCPKASKNIYIDGAKLYNHLISKNQGSEELQKAYLDSLEALYDNRIANFGKEDYVLGLKGSDMMKYSFSDLDRAFTYLKQSVEGQEAKSKATALFFILQSCYRKI